MDTATEILTKKQEKRKKNIKKKKKQKKKKKTRTLGCKFIRSDPDKEDFYVSELSIKYLNI